MLIICTYILGMTSRRSMLRSGIDVVDGGYVDYTQNTSCEAES